MGQPEKAGFTLQEVMTKANVSLASSWQEADKKIQEFNPEFQGEETDDLIEKKYNYVKRIFQLEDIAPAPQNPTEIKHNYDCLLSVLILRKWDNCSSSLGTEGFFDHESDGEGDGYCSIL